MITVHRAQVQRAGGRGKVQRFAHNDDLAKRKRLPIRWSGPGVACAFATLFIRVATISVPA
jgi:hypothetical protein